MATYNIAVKTVEGSHIEIPSNIIIPTRYNDGNVIAIASNAFENCDELVSIKLPDNTVRIGASAFSGCTGLTSIVIPSKVVYIEANAFNGCTGLTSIEIPSSVESMGAGVFSGCSSTLAIKVNAPQSSVSGWTSGWNGSCSVEYLPEPTYPISINKNAGGSVVSSHTQAEANTAITLTITPSSGYRVKEVKVNNEVLSAPYQFNMPAGDTVISVEFEKIPRIIQVTAPNSAGDDMEIQEIEFNTTQQGYYFEVGSKVSEIVSTIKSNERLNIQYYDTNTSQWYTDELAGGWTEERLTGDSYAYKYVETANATLEGPIQLRALVVA